MVMTIQAYAAHKADGVWYKPLFSLIPTLSIIGNVSIYRHPNTQWRNDSQTPVQQAFLLQQRLTEVNHPDRTLITYQTSGIFFSFQFRI